jgi:alpha-L-arabinofuranosidase
VKDDDNYAWWNIGGWNNTRHAVEFCEDGWRVLLGQQVTGSVETNHWYDIKIEIRGQHIKCYLDGTLVHDVVYEHEVLRSLHAVAGRDAASGDIVVKVVNVSRHPFDTGLEILGTEPLQPVGSALVLTSGDPKDENSLESPKKVYPRGEQINGIAGTFRRTFPPYSLTVLRLKETQ